MEELVIRTPQMGGFRTYGCSTRACPEPYGSGLVWKDAGSHLMGTGMKERMKMNIDSQPITFRLVSKGT